MQEPPPIKKDKALPRPDDKVSKKRGGGCMPVFSASMAVCTAVAEGIVLHQVENGSVR